MLYIYTPAPTDPHERNPMPKRPHLDRIAILVPDLDEAVARWTELLGCEFTVVEAAEFGVRAALSDCGVELVCPVGGGDDNPVRQNANGVLGGVFFRVDDIEETRRHAEEQGLRVFPGFDIGVPGRFREIGFDKTTFDGVPVGLQEFPGDSFTGAVFSMGDAAPPPV
jgi:catechol 2,3-dioxygenase-like lactoylglutathione lyase family enzyme